MQNPTDALYPAMPKNALQAGMADYEANVSEMGRLLTKLTEPEIERFEMTGNLRMELENRIAMGRRFARDAG